MISIITWTDPKTGLQIYIDDKGDTVLLYKGYNAIIPKKRMKQIGQMMVREYLDKGRELDDYKIAESVRKVIIDAFFEEFDIFFKGKNSIN